jgi:hypothetical protein
VTGHSRCRNSAVCVTLIAAALVVGSPTPAQATTATLKRSLQNLLLFPVDFILSPYVATRATYNNWRASDDTDAVKIAYALPAVPWAVSVNMGASMMRGLAGALELFPGIVLVPFEADMEPLYDLSEQNAALYDSGEEGAVRVRLGVDYISPSEF